MWDKMSAASAAKALESVRQTVDQAPESGQLAIWASHMLDAARAGVLDKETTRSQIRDEESALMLLDAPDMDASDWIELGGNFEGLGWRVEARVAAEFGAWSDFERALGEGAAASAKKPGAFDASLAQLARWTVWKGRAEACERLESKWLPYRADTFGESAWLSACQRAWSRGAEHEGAQAARLKIAIWQRRARPAGFERQNALARKGEPSLWAIEFQVSAQNSRALRRAWAMWEKQPGAEEDGERFKWLERGADALRTSVGHTTTNEESAECSRFLLDRGWSQETSDAMEATLRKSAEGKPLFARLALGGFDLTRQPGRLGRAAVEAGLRSGAPQWALEHGARFSKPAEGGQHQGESALAALENGAISRNSRLRSDVEALREWVGAAIEREKLVQAAEGGRASTALPSEDKPARRPKAL
jgi:hypothetical protein